MSDDPGVSTVPDPVPQRVTPFTEHDITQILQTHWHEASQSVRWVGAGAWSDCFAFDCDGGRSVVRVGTHGEDFSKDHLIAPFASQAVPIPACSKPRPLPDGYYFCVSDYVEGDPLERVTPWSDIAPGGVAGAMTCGPPSAHGAGFYST